MFGALRNSCAKGFLPKSGAGRVMDSRIPLPTDSPRFHAGLYSVNFGDRLEVGRNFAC